MLELFPKFFIVNDEKNEETKLKNANNIGKRNEDVKHRRLIFMITVQHQNHCYHTHHNIEERKACDVHTNYFSLLHFTSSKALTSRHVLFKVDQRENP